MFTKEKNAFTAAAELTVTKFSDPDYFNEALYGLEEKHKCIHSTVIGESIMGRPIHAVTLGSDRMARGVLFVGGLCGDDGYSPAVLLRFVRDYAEFLESGKRICSVSLPYLYANRCIHVIPMLNPDGYAIRKHGAEDIPIRDRLIAINGSEDFSSWKFNARGIDLSENFTELSDSPNRGIHAESEPETAALCSYIRMAESGIFGKIELAMELHGRNSFIRCSSGDVTASRSRTVARLLSRMTECEVQKTSAPAGELCDYFLRDIGRCAFSCGFAREDSEIQSVHDEYLRIYTAFREALFSAPLLI